MPEEPVTPPGPAAVPPAGRSWPAFADDDGEPFDAVAFFNPYSGPPEGEDAWLADVPAAVRDEYLDNKAPPPAARETLAAGFTRNDHAAGARGFAAGGRLDQLEPGPVLAGFAAGAWDGGLAVLSDDQGGRTCECNLAALCRRHHAAKQAPGWHLQQPQPGTLVWTLPNGRTHTTKPRPYNA